MNIKTYLDVIGDHDSTDKMRWGALSEALRCICEAQEIDVEYDPIAPPQTTEPSKGLE